MTREEAIKVLQREKDYVQQAIQKATYGDGYVSPDGLIRADDYVAACTEAISALRQQDHFREVTKKVEPLTLDELRQMDGEPVWCEIYIKGQPSFYGIVHGETVTGFISGDDKPANLAITNVGAYGLAWLAYRQKPEDGTV